MQGLNQKQVKGLTLLDVPSDAFPSFKAYQRIAHRPESWRVRHRKWVELKAQQSWATTSPIDLPQLPVGETEIMGTLTPLRRGIMPLRRLLITCPDPLGLFNTCVTNRQLDSILILPKRYQLPSIQLPGGRRHQSGGVALASSVGESEEFRSLREYRPGDPLRKIHWKSWAKAGKPFVREEQDEYFVRHALILDTFQTDAHSNQLEEAVAIAASLACEVHTQESLLDLMFVGLDSHTFTVGRGLGQTERMLELLASVVPCQDRPFESMIPVIQKRLSLLSGCICVLLTWDEARKALIQKLQSFGIPTLVLIITHVEGLGDDAPELDCLKVPQSQFHLLKLGQIQDGLWQL